MCHFHKPWRSAENGGPKSCTNGDNCSFKHAKNQAEYEKLNKDKSTPRKGAVAILRGCVARFFQPTIHALQSETHVKRSGHKEYASPHEARKSQYLYFHRTSGGRPEDAKRAYSNKKTKKKKAAIFSKIRPPLKLTFRTGNPDLHIRTSKGIRCWRSGKQANEGDVIRVTGIWEHHCDGVFPANGLVSSPSRFPSSPPQRRCPHSCARRSQHS